MMFKSLAWIVAALLSLGGAGWAQQDAGPDSVVLYDFSSPVEVDSVSPIGAEVSAVEGGDKPGIRVAILGREGSPGIRLSTPAVDADLAAFDGIETEVTNLGSSRVSLHIRLDNPRNAFRENPEDPVQPTSGSQLTLKPGETGMLRVVFGRAYGKPVPSFNPARITGILIFMPNPEENSVVQIGNLRTFKKPPQPSADGPAPSPSS